MKKILLVVFLFAFFDTAYAVPITYDLNMTATLGSAGPGSFGIDSSSLSALPATGLYFSPADSIQAISVTVNGILFDTLGSSNIFAAADGQASGITGITYSDFFSSASPGLTLHFDTSNGNPYGWYMYASTGSGYLASGDYTVGASYSTVPEPATILLMLIGSAALRLSYKKRRA